MKCNDEMEIVVVGSDHYNTLGVVRSIGIAGLKCHLVITEPHLRSFVASSKYVSQCIRTSSNPEDIISAIFQLTEQLRDQQIVIVPTTDTVAIAIDEHYNDFAPNIIVPSCKGEMLKLSDKEYMKMLAQESSMNVPHYQIIDLSIEQKEHSWNSFPAIIKPLRSIEGNKSDIKIVWSKEELADYFENIKRIPNSTVIIEEYIHADKDYMIEYMGYVRKNGECVISGALKKIREYPLGKGSTSYAEVYPNLPDIDISSIQTFLAKTKFYGIFDIEYKSDGEKAYFLEINYRNGAPSYSLNAIGRNIVYDWITDKSQDEMITKDNNTVRVIHEFNDFKNIKKAKIKFSKWFVEYKNAEVKLVYNSRDIKPVYSYILKRTWDKLVIKIKQIFKGK